jgi:hypothetical protein
MCLVHCHLTWKDAVSAVRTMLRVVIMECQVGERSLVDESTGRSERKVVRVRILIEQGSMGVLTAQGQKTANELLSHGTVLRQYI